MYPPDVSVSQQSCTSLCHQPLQRTSSASPCPCTPAGPRSTHRPGPPPCSFEDDPADHDLAVLPVHVIAAVGQEADAIAVTALGGVQEGPACNVPDLQTAASASQSCGHVGMPGSGRAVQRRASRIVPGVHGRAAAGPARRAINAVASGRGQEACRGFGTGIRPCASGSRRTPMRFESPCTAATPCGSA